MYINTTYRCQHSLHSKLSPAKTLIVPGNEGRLQNGFLYSIQDALRNILNSCDRSFYWSNLGQHSGLGI
jgi:hypothetical protein